ncbi:uncharacterized protein A4U43_C03F25950 [Asparagus officinalis]|uniref:Uncharacterized protein n=1 Tax=Asparagus officinalis TaxID=4686 RepID=A0A5P1FHA2_ASPOF|nr:uncharacterized protein A4U43_C03F25950 [Asparagus officinalis]
MGEEEEITWLRDWAGTEAMRAGRYSPHLWCSSLAGVCPTLPTAIPDVTPTASQGDGDDAKILFADVAGPGTEENLKHIFEKTGNCTVKIPTGKGCDSPL